MPPRAPSEAQFVAGPEQLAALLSALEELLLVVSPEGTILYSSSGLAGLLTDAPEQLAGQSVYRLFVEQDRPAIKRLLCECSYASKTRCRCRLQTEDGGDRWFDVVARDCSLDPAVQGLLLVLSDASAAHRMESERQVIAEVVHALNETSNLDQLLCRIHQALKGILYAENCFVALNDTETDLFSFPFFADEFDTRPAPQRVDRSCTALVFRTGRAMLIPQQEFDRLAAQGEVELVGSPSPSWLGVPLKTPSATIGVLVVQHYQNPNAYDLRDLEFLDSVGGHIALAIERRRAEDALRSSESMFRHLFTQTPLPTWVFDAETLRFLQVNEAAERQYGYTAEEFATLSLLDILPESERAEFPAHLKQLVAQGRAQERTRHRKKDGKAFEVELIAHPLDYAGRQVRLVVAQDLSERHLLEEQLRQAQKMEAVGRLAGGVAHDFNNLLMVIKGHSEMLLSLLAPTEQASRKIEQIDRAADRATSLTRQLLAFSRMQVLQPRVINLNSVIEEMGRLLPRLIGEDIELVVRTRTDLGAIRADASQMEQVIMNLAVNSRDAMPCGGRLVIETSNAELDDAYAVAHPIVRAGKYVLLAVSDTGTGMDEQTRAHIFEPFFTTKDQGKGTGLGLSTVYGVVKQSGGFIWVYSEVGKGTSFKIYLPRVDEEAERAATLPSTSETPAGTETVLLAEDEQDVREVAREFLESGGYTVLEARDGGEAMSVAASHVGSIDLLVTDMVMPGMTGPELAGRLQQKCHGLQVLYMSGYSEHRAASTSQGDSSLRLLTKPFSRSAILRLVRQTLNEAGRHRVEEPGLPQPSDCPAKRSDRGKVEFQA
jgi:two-component system, cell cycle sensor histidine kinase and response regulator CckA